MGLVKHEKLSKTEYSGLSEKDEDTLYAVNENGDFSESNMDDSAELYIGDKKIGGIEYDLATETADGLMSADDKKKTNAITVDATKKSVAIGYDNTNTGNSSFVVGNSNSVTHNNSVALGQGLKSNAQNQTILGKFNTPSTTDIFTIGYGTSDTDRKNIFTISNKGGINNNIKNFRVFTDESVGEYGIAMGQQASTSNAHAIALGRSSSATGMYAIAMGNIAKASKSNSIAIGNQAKSNGAYSVAMSSYATANGDYSAVFGYMGMAGVLTGDDTYKYGKLSVKSTLVFTYNSSTVYGVSVPKQTPITFIYNGIEYTIENNNTANSSLFLIQDTNNTLFKADLSPKHISVSHDSYNVGNMRVLSSTHLQNGVYALLVNQQDGNIFTYNQQPYLFLWEKSSSSNNKANGAVNLGYQSYCAGNYSSCFGEQSIASGANSVSFGRFGMVAGDNSFSSGILNSVAGANSFAVGANNIITNGGSFVKGLYNKALHNNSTLIGVGLISNRSNQTILGNYNALDNTNIFIIGQGDSRDNRKNIFSISKDGLVTAPTFKGALQGNADTATKVNNLLTIVKGLVTYTYDGSAPVRIDLSDVSGGGGEASISIVQSTGYSAEDVMSQNATTLALYDGMPKFNGFVENKTFSTTLSPSNNGYVVYDTMKKTFRFYNTDNSTYYLRWVDDVNYVTINNNASAPISNRFYVCNKQHYIFENGNLNIASGGSVDLSDYYTKTEVNSELGKKANTADLSTVANTGDYNDLENKPTIPAAVTESTVSGWGFTKNTGNYNKPSSGIPKSDLASDVKTSLGKADTALQEEQYKGTVTGVKMNGTTKNPSNGVVDLGTVITAHQDISGKQDKLVSGSNIKTINGQSLLGEGDITISGGNGESSSNCTIPTFAGFLPSSAIVIEESTESINGEVLYDQNNNRFVFKDISTQIVKYYANWTESYLYNNTDVFPAVAKNDKLFYYNNAHYRVINGVLSVISETEGYVDTKIKDLSSSLSAQINSANAKTLAEAKQYADGKSTEALTSAKQYTDSKIQYLPNQDAYNAITPIEGVLYLIGDE